MTRSTSALSLLALLALAACATADAPRSLSQATAGAGDSVQLRRACEAEAERAVNFRERGQDSRLDRELGQTDQTNTTPSLRVQADTLALTRRIADEMSAIVLDHPESYLWPHRRWRQYRRHVTGRARRREEIDR